jgi:hypothetical protein
MREKSSNYDINWIYIYVFPIALQPLVGQGLLIFTITLRHTTLGRTPLDEWSARRWDLCLATHNTQKKQTSMPPEEFEPVIPASEWPQTHALDRTATGIVSWKIHKG